RKSAARLRKIDDMARRLLKLEKAVETVTCSDIRSSDG
ncbi:UDP-3-O-(3-hydroxymyristoyl)glucosamine N-acyltransferase, partial [Pseudomonas syringae pv. tagetis]